MKVYIIRSFIWITLSILMSIFWIVGLMIGNAVFPSELMEMPQESSGTNELMLVLTCALNTAVLLIYIYRTTLKGIKLAITIAIITFGIQFFMSQIETLWFNDSLQFPVRGVWAIMSGGALMAFLFGISATWITGNFKGESTEVAHLQSEKKGLLIQRVILVSVVLWPLVYFSAGYLIAWQVPEVRQFYSGYAEMSSFASIMLDNITSGLYFFQIVRGLLWIMIAYLVLSSTYGTTLQKGIVLGLLLSFLGSSQLLLPNPYMSEGVRMAHLIETATSSFAWGIILSYSFSNFIITESKQNKITA